MPDIEETRAIVGPDETYEGKLIPTRRPEIDRPVTVHEGASVTEGVYGQDVEILEGARIGGSIMAQDSVDFTGATLTADVGTPGKVLGKRGTVFGTVIATKITLKNCLVYGNVVGEDVILDNCLVLGVAIGEREFDLLDTICYTFKSFGEATIDGTEIVLPQAIADGTLDLEEPINVIAIPDESLDETRDGTAHLTEGDLYEYDGIRYLSLAPRLLRLSSLRDQIQLIEELVSDITVSLNSSPGDGQPPYDRNSLEMELRNIGQKDAS